MTDTVSEERAALLGRVTLAWNAPLGESAAGYVIYQATIGADGSNSPGGAVAQAISADSMPRSLPSTTRPHCSQEGAAV